MTIDQVLISQAPGEWRGGVAPPRSRRTVHEPLSSYGSYCRATPRTQLPVSKELWTALSNTQQPLLGSAETVLQLLVFPRRPPGEHAVVQEHLAGGETLDAYRRWVHRTFETYILARQQY